MNTVERPPNYRVLFRADAGPRPRLVRAGESFEGRPAPRPGLLVCRSVGHLRAFLEALNSAAAGRGGAFYATARLDPGDPPRDRFRGRIETGDWRGRHDP